MYDCNNSIVIPGGDGMVRGISVDEEGEKENIICWEFMLIIDLLYNIKCRTQWQQQQLYQSNNNTARI